MKFLAIVLTVCTFFTSDARLDSSQLSKEHMFIWYFNDTNEVNKMSRQTSAGEIVQTSNITFENKYIISEI